MGGVKKKRKEKWETERRKSEIKLKPVSGWETKAWKPGEACTGSGGIKYMTGREERGMWKERENLREIYFIA